MKFQCFLAVSKKVYTNEQFESIEIMQNVDFLKKFFKCCEKTFKKGLFFSY